MTTIAVTGIICAVGDGKVRRVKRDKPPDKPVYSLCAEIIPVINAVCDEIYGLPFRISAEARRVAAEGENGKRNPMPFRSLYFVKSAVLCISFADIFPQSGKIHFVIVINSEPAYAEGVPISGGAARKP